jgi:hypothetical protein
MIDKRRMLMIAVAAFTAALVLFIVRATPDNYFWCAFTWSDPESCP